MSLKDKIQTAIESGQKVLVDYYRDSCPPCKGLAMQLAKVEQNNPDILIVKIKANSSEEETEMFQFKNIQSVPQLFFYQNGKEIAHMTGATPYSKIIDVFS